MLQGETRCAMHNAILNLKYPLINLILVFYVSAFLHSDRKIVFIQYLISIPSSISSSFQFLN